ncbi:DUF2207 domain-containing protein [Candidatus Berkelbacteria bacterium]|nr:DUF2207 domain-containing protein [Candidatus Berkelbacteria bacterium]
MRGLITIGLLLILSFSTASAQTYNPIEELAFKATLQSDGSIFAEQTITNTYSDPIDWKIFSNVQNVKVFADETELSPRQYSLIKSSGSVRITSSKFARVWQISYKTTSTLIRHNDRDQFFYKLLENPATTIFNISGELILPQTTKNISANIYGIGGVGSKNTEIEGNKIIFSALGAGPQSLITFNASWPKDILNLTPWANIKLTLLNLELIPWLFLGLFLPILTVAIYLTLRATNRKNSISTSEVINSPIDTLSPMFVGTLVNKKVYPEEVVAMIIDLCQRGYLMIVKKINGFYLTPRKEIDHNLAPWEAEILSQIFASVKDVTSKEFTKETSNQLFSKKVKNAFAQIYNVITAQKYFTENPHITRIKVKLFGLAIFFFALGAIIWNTISGTNAFLLIPLIGTLLMSRAILAMAPNLIKYTEQGLNEKSEWLKFANFLKSDQPLEISKVQSQYYEKFLAYAVALRCEKEWAKRFENSEIFAAKPDWLVSYEDTNTPQLTTELIEFIGSVSTNISKLRGPIVS